MAHRTTISRSGIQIAYSVEGEGPLVLLIQGLGMSSKSWLHASDPLVRRGYRVAAIDNRGTGKSEWFPPSYSMRQMAADAAFVIDHLGEPAIVAGISLGGMIAQHVAINHPEMVCGLVLAATTVGPPFGRLPSPSVLRALTFGLLGYRKSMDEMREYLVHPATLMRDPALFNEFDRVVKSERRSTKTVMRQLAAASVHNTYFSVRQIRVPVEIVAGDSDVVIPTVNALILARRIQNAALTILPRAAHAFPLEYPLAIPDAIVRVHARLQQAQRDP